MEGLIDKPLRPALFCVPRQAERHRSGGVSRPPQHLDRGGAHGNDRPGKRDGRLPSGRPRELDDRVRRVGTGRLTPTPSTWRAATPARPGGGKVPVRRRAPRGLGGCLRAGRTSVDDFLGTEPGAAAGIEGLAAVLDGRPRQTLGQRASSETLHHLLPPASARASQQLGGRRRSRRPRRSRFGHDGDGRSRNRSPPSAGRFTSNTASRRGRTLPSRTRTPHAGQTSLINLTYSTTGFSSPACVGSTLGRRKFRPRLGL